jgi:hypothetical protein
VGGRVPLDPLATRAQRLAEMTLAYAATAALADRPRAAAGRLWTNREVCAAGLWDRSTSPIVI